MNSACIILIFLFIAHLDTKVVQMTDFSIG
jgi:hypothetical protein